MAGFKKFYSELDPNEKKSLSDRSGISLSYLSRIATGFRKAGWKTIRKLIKSGERIGYEMFENPTVSTKPQPLESARNI